MGSSRLVEFVVMKSMWFGLDWVSVLVISISVMVLMMVIRMRSDYSL